MVGVLRAFVFHHRSLIGQFVYVKTTEPLPLFFLLRSFATGCSAMTGVEAISNGGPAYRKSEARNVAITLTWTTVMLGPLFFGIAVLAMTCAVGANPTVISMIALHLCAGPLIFLYPVFQIATPGILALCAVTRSFDFPHLAPLLARDRFLPIRASVSHSLSGDPDQCASDHLSKQISTCLRWGSSLP